MSRNEQGGGMIELLIVLPIVLWLGLGALQVALVMHARASVAYAAHEAARAGSVGHALDEAIEEGLARGLLPWLFGAPDAASFEANLARSIEHVGAAMRAGWLVIERLSPTEQSFGDWAEPARDRLGEVIAGTREIPNDNLSIRAGVQRPAGAVAGYRGIEPIGELSGQTLADANLLKLRLTYGVPLDVPFVGALAGWLMRQFDGCEAPSSRRVGLMNLSREPAGDRNDWRCPYYRSLDQLGNPRVRWPVRVAATVRMQSPARTAGGATRVGTARPNPTLGVGEIDSEPAWESWSGMPRFDPQRAESHVERGPGFLRLGGQRIDVALGTCAQR